MPNDLEGLTELLASAGFVAANEEADELIARAAHELRGPITAARLAVDLGARGGELTAERLRAVELELDRATLALDDLGGTRSRSPRRAGRIAGRSRQVVSVEEETPIADIPSAAREAIQKAAGGGKVLVVETVTEGGKTFYEAQVRNGLKKSEVKVDASGQPVK